MSRKRKSKAKSASRQTLSRRAFFTLGAAGIIAATIVGCNTLNSDPIVEVLPDGDETGLPNLSHDNIIPPVLNPLPGPDGIIPRTSWTRSGPADPSRLTPMNGVQRITFHHSGDGKPFTATDTATVAIHLEAIRRFHTNPVHPPNPKDAGRGWADIAYHFAIDPAGRIWQLRSLKYEGSHVLHNNPHNLGVVVLGDFELQNMTRAQQARIQQFSPILRKQFSVPYSQVKTHREIMPTDCPGKNMQPFIVALRSQNLL